MELVGRQCRPAQNLHWLRIAGLPNHGQGLLPLSLALCDGCLASATFPILNPDPSLSSNNSPSSAQDANGCFFATRQLKIWGFGCQAEKRGRAVWKLQMLWMGNQTLEPRALYSAWGKRSCPRCSDAGRPGWPLKWSCLRNWDLQVGDVHSFSFQQRQEGRQAGKQTDQPTRRHANTQTHNTRKHTNTQTHKHTNTQTQTWTQLCLWKMGWPWWIRRAKP